LVALANGSNIKGQFFLGSGFVGSHLTYTYVTKRDGYYTLHSKAADSNTLLQQGVAHPEKDVYHQTVTNPWLWPWPLPLDDVTVFRVPDGTVAQKYSVDVTK
jgi:hypothetical protein